jgi:hypothetical protein
MTPAPPTTAPAPTAPVCPYCDEPLPADTAPNRWDGCAACADWIEHAPDPLTPSAPVRPLSAWDTRCVRGCGAVVVEPAQSCGPCTETAMRTHWAADVAAVRREWAWVLERQAK